MLVISRLASYAGVTVAAVRHYHRIGLLPEPERNHSGYRSYGAAAVVRLIRVHVLASAGVPLARVEELLEADAEEFAGRLREIDRTLRVEIRRLQDTRRIMIAAQVPDEIEESMRGKHRDLDSPDMVRLYRLISSAPAWEADGPFIRLLDTTMIESAPAAVRKVELLEKRGWEGWTRIERRPVDET